VDEREYSQLETSKIQAVCNLANTQWNTNLPELYPWMLEEGCTMTRVKALLENIFLLDNLSLWLRSPHHDQQNGHEYLKRDQPWVQ
jgi:hypothetical protein